MVLNSFMFVRPSPVSSLASVAVMVRVKVSSSIIASSPMGVKRTMVSAGTV